MSLTCNTCDKIIPTTCIKYQGVSLYFEKDLKSKNDIDEIVKVITDKLQKLEEIANTKIDTKNLNLPCDVKSPMQLLQFLIDKQAESKLIETNNNLNINSTQDCCNQLIDVSSLSNNCGNNQNVSINQAVMMMMNEIQFLKTQITNTQSNIYLPNDY